MYSFFRTLTALAVLAMPTGLAQEALPTLPPVEWTAAPAAAGASRWAVLVVADKYENAAWNLESADKVVERLRASLAKGLGIRDDHVRMIRGSDVTAPAIGRTLRQLGEGLRGKGNLVLFYYYGHGWTEGGRLRLFTRDTDLVGGGTFTDTVGWDEVGRGFASLWEAAARHQAEVRVVSVVDACRVKTQAPPGPATYAPMERVVASLFSTKAGSFANEGVFCEAFAGALEAFAGRDQTKLGDVVDATARKLAEGKTGQEPDLVQGERDLVLRRADDLSLEVEAWDPVGPGRRLNGATVVLGERRGPSPLVVTGLRPGYRDVRVEHPGYMTRTVGVDLGLEHAASVLRVPLLPNVVVVAGEVAAPADATVKIRLAAPRPEGTVDGYHVLAAERRGSGAFMLRLPTLPAGLQLLVGTDGTDPVRVDVPAIPTAHEGALKIPRHDVPRVSLAGASAAGPPAAPPPPAPQPGPRAAGGNAHAVVIDCMKSALGQVLDAGAYERHGLGTDGACLVGGWLSEGADFSFKRRLVKGRSYVLAGAAGPGVKNLDLTVTDGTDAVDDTEEDGTPWIALKSDSDCEVTVVVRNAKGADAPDYCCVVILEDGGASRAALVRGTAALVQAVDGETLDATDGAVSIVGAYLSTREEISLPRPFTPGRYTVVGRGDASAQDMDLLVRTDKATVLEDSTKDAAPTVTVHARGHVRGTVNLRMFQARGGAFGGFAVLRAK